MKPLTLILADAALELVPQSLWRHPAVRARARTLGKPPGETLLDRSYHHTAMKRLPDGERRGRPDLVHMALMAAVATPLYLKGLLDLRIHTYGEVAIQVAPGVRLPHSYHRFQGLMEQLLVEGEVSTGGKTLLKAEPKSLPQLLGELAPDPLIALSRRGERRPLEALAQHLTRGERPTLVIGAFPRGPYRPQTLNALRELYSISTLGLETHLVVARALYEYEKAIGLEH